VQQTERTTERHLDAWRRPSWCSGSAVELAASINDPEGKVAKVQTELFTRCARRHARTSACALTGCRMTPSAAGGEVVHLGVYGRKPDARIGGRFSSV
jgi:hypothetical protein